MLARLLLTYCLGSLCLASQASAEASDPFDTERQLPFQSGLLQTDALPPCTRPPAMAPLTLPEIVDQALCHNPRTREAWANARAQAAQVGVAQGAYLPELNASGSMGPKRSTVDGNSRNYTQKTANLTLSYLLYDFGGREADLENARQLLNAAIATQDATSQSVFLAALEAFYQVHATEAALLATWESERAAQESFKAADARYLTGIATPADKLQAQTAYSQAKLTRIKAEGARQNARGTLANVMGLDAQSPLVLAPIQPIYPDPQFEKELAALVAEARRNRPDLQAAEARYQAAQASIASARANGMPTISLNAGPSYQATDSVITHSNSIGISVSIPLFSGFTTTYQVRSAEALAQASAAQRDQLALQVALDVWQSYQNLLTATQTLRTTADLLASAELSEQVALGRYKAGVGNILDVLNAQSALANARLQRIQSAFDWHISRATLAQAMGLLNNQGLSVLSAP